MSPTTKSANAATNWSVTGDEEILTSLGQRLVQSLTADLGKISPAAPFCLWLKGDLGAGKTTLAGAILRALGLNPALPVTSPTYTYVNEYQIKDLWFAHLDLYRAGVAFSLDDLGLTGYREYAGYLVEWPEQIPSNPTLAPTHVLTIEFTDTARTYRFEKV